MDDVRSCYRLLLDREPDASALDLYGPRVRAGQLTVRVLAQELLASEEFANRHRQLFATGAPASQRVEAEGFVLYVDPEDRAIGRTIAQTRTHEPVTTEVVRSLLGPGDTVVDVGANVGWFSMLAAAAVGPTGRVLAVEPNPANCALIERSAADNGFGHVQVVAAAAADHPGVAALETDGSNGRIVPLETGLDEAMACSFVVPIRTLDDLVTGAGLDAVSLVKVDVEGAEPLVLRGASGTLRRRPVVVCEFFPLLLRGNFGSDPSDFLKQLRSLGYDIAVVGGDGPEDDAAIMRRFEADSVDDHIDLVATAAAGPGRAGEATGT